MSFELSESEVEELFTDTDIAQMMDFLESATKACPDRGQAYSFRCPICGTVAHAERAKCNGHLHAHCPGCGVGVME